MTEGRLLAHHPESAAALAVHLAARSGRRVLGRRRRLVEVYMDMLALRYEELTRFIWRSLREREHLFAEIVACREALRSPSVFGRAVPGIELPPEALPPKDCRLYLRGAQVRISVTEILRATGRSLTVPEIQRYLVGLGMEPPPSKVISDALRAEVRTGRVARLGRGLYRWVGGGGAAGDSP